MGFSLQDVCLKCIPEIYSHKKWKEILDNVIYSQKSVCYRFHDPEASTVRELEHAGYIVSTEIDRDRLALSINLRRVQVKNGKWICFRRHKKAPHS